MNENAGGLYAIAARLLDGQTMTMDHFRGKVLLIVNTASKCGFTPQYAGLEELYRRYHSRGFEVLGFPCNQFGAQEPGGAEQIGQFCERNYGVSFPIFEKIEVNGANTHPLFHLLKDARPGLLGTKRIKWNFTKFLVDRAGNVVSRHPPSEDPLKLTPEIEALLAGQ